jgi:23S rRNA (adenine2503-C2)-methyltransferase
MKKDLRGLTLEELQESLKVWKQPAFAGRQIFSWIYRRKAIDFDSMSDLSKDSRSLLKENFTINGPDLVETQTSSDGTKKFLFKLKDANLIEAVMIPTDKRLTGCISSQAGCKFKCAFCASGISGFRRNLETEEIVGEVFALKNNSADNGLTHIVFMGTGEPLDNYDNVLKAIRIINSKFGFNIGARRITISTCGIIPGIKKLSQEGMQIELSVSLHAADDKTRNLLMPVNKVYPLKELLAACRYYVERTNRQVTFEYVLIKGLNCGLQDSLNLSKILRGLNCKINLIASNPVKESGFIPPNKLQALAFRQSLLKSGIKATLRKERGKDIDAACGQLRLRYEKV